jgi:hypothetical protein
MASVDQQFNVRDHEYYEIHNGPSNRFKIRGMFTMKTIKKNRFL